MEKFGFGLMILLMAVGVLTAPFFYARSMKYLSRKRKNANDAASSADADDGV